MRKTLIILALLAAPQAHAGVLCNALASAESCERSEARSALVDALRREKADQEMLADQRQRQRCEPVTWRDENGRLHETINGDNCSRY